MSLLSSRGGGDEPHNVAASNPPSPTTTPQRGCRRSSVALVAVSLLAALAALWPPTEASLRPIPSSLLLLASDDHVASPHSSIHLVQTATRETPTSERGRTFAAIGIVYSVAEHPACAAERYLREASKEGGSSAAAEGDVLLVAAAPLLPPPSDDSADHVFVQQVDGTSPPPRRVRRRGGTGKQEREDDRPGVSAVGNRYKAWNCFKHGGYQPGIPRASVSMRELTEYAGRLSGGSSQERSAAMTSDPGAEKATDTTREPNGDDVDVTLEAWPDGVEAVIWLRSTSAVHRWTSQLSDTTPKPARLILRPGQLLRRASGLDGLEASPDDSELGRPAGDDRLWVSAAIDPSSGDIVSPMMIEPLPVEPPPPPHGDDEPPPRRRRMATSVRRVTVKLAGMFSMVSGNWPQTVTSEVSLRSPANDAEWRLLLSRGGINGVAAAGHDAGSRHQGAGAAAYYYYQGQTDFISTFHVVVEVVLPMLHTLMRQGLLPALSPPGANVSEGTATAAALSFFAPRLTAANVTSIIMRPSFSRHGFKPNSCKHGPDLCLNTEWAKMYLSVLAFAASGLTSPSSSSPHRPLGREASLDGLVHLQSTNGAGGRMEAGRGVLVGYPLHCESLWGSDAILIHEAMRHDALLRGQAAYAVPGHRHREAVFPESSRRAAADCDRALWMLRTIALLPVATVPLPAVQELNDAVDVRRDGIRILWSSRSGDWARHIVNETEVLSDLRSWLGAAFGPGTDYNLPRSSLTVEAIRFSGDFKRIAARVAARNVTLFVGPHGANLLPLVYLRRNAAAVTLDAVAAGFMPYVTAPTWIHWRRVIVSQACNPRTSPGGGGKCKWSNFNNNNMLITGAELRRIRAAIRSVVDSQLHRRPL